MALAACLVGSWKCSSADVAQTRLLRFYPNPRGSSGRGQAFARQVLHDMGGADAGDYLSGIDDLVDSGKVDAGKLGSLARATADS